MTAARGDDGKGVADVAASELLGDGSVLGGWQ